MDKAKEMRERESLYTSKYICFIMYNICVHLGTFYLPIRERICKHCKLMGCKSKEIQPRESFASEI